jgi:hypothetical protein
MEQALPTEALDGQSNTFYDNTILSSYKDCPRKYFIRHRLNWRSEGTSMPLVFGLGWHSGMSAVWVNAQSTPPPELVDLATEAFLATWTEQGLPARPGIEQLERLGARTPATAREMYTSYINKRWRMLVECDVLADERPFAVPMPGFENVWYVGRMDKVIQTGGQTVVVEHKTTTDYKIDGGFNDAYLEGWNNDSQVKGYEFAGTLYYARDVQVWVDAALVHKKVHDAFKFIPIAHQVPILTEWVETTAEWIRRLQSDTMFPKNESACNGKYGRCPYADICRSVADPRELGGCPPGFVEERWEPFSLLELDKIIKGS